MEKIITSIEKFETVTIQGFTDTHSVAVIYYSDENGKITKIQNLDLRNDLDLQFYNCERMMFKIQQNKNK